MNEKFYLQMILHARIIHRDSEKKIIYKMAKEEETYSILFFCKTPVYLNALLWWLFRFYLNFFSQNTVDVNLDIASKFGNITAITLWYSIALSVLNSAVIRMHYIMHC